MTITIREQVSYLHNVSLKSLGVLAERGVVLN